MGDSDGQGINMIVTCTGDYINEPRATVGPDTMGVVRKMNDVQGWQEESILHIVCPYCRDMGTEQTLVFDRVCDRFHSTAVVCKLFPVQFKTAIYPAKWPAFSFVCLGCFYCAYIESYLDTTINWARIPESHRMSVLLWYNRADVQIAEVT